MAATQLSLIITTYNEGPTFEKNVASIVGVLHKLKQRWEIIFVEDKSIDDTVSKVENFVQKINNSRAIYHKKNMGRGKSVYDGIIASRGQICGFLDVDCEISPRYLPIFIREIEAGYDMAIGNRFYENSFGNLSRVSASKIYSFAVNHFLGIPLHDTEAGFKFFNRNKILPVLKKTRDTHWFFDTEICARAYYGGLKIGEVPVIFKKRSDKKSTVRLFHDSLDYLIKITRFKSQLNSLNLKSEK